MVLDSPQKHKGDVRCLIYTVIDGIDVLISGSADRTVKLWEPKNNKTNKCFQTIIGHNGTILDMVYLEKVQILITASTEKMVRLWRIDKARQLLMYPWFVEYYKINEFVSANHPNSTETSLWMTCFDTRIGESLQVYAGDSEGSIFVFEAQDTWREAKDCAFRLKKKFDNHHRIGII